MPETPEKPNLRELWGLDIQRGPSVLSCDPGEGFPVSKLLNEKGHLPAVTTANAFSLSSREGP